MPEPTAPTRPIVLRVQGSPADYAWPEASDPRLAGLSRLRVGRMRVTIEAAKPLRLPPLAGSALRGALGWAVLDALESGSASPALDCIFGTTGAGDSRHAQGAPRPIVVSTRGGHPPAGGRFEAELVLVGPLIDALADLVAALDAACRGGIGVRRTPCRLIGVELSPAAGSAGTLSASNDADLHLAIRTPARVKANGVFVDEISFETLARTALRRVSDLVRLYGTPPDPLAWPFAELIETARQVETVTATWKVVRTTRWSNRQGRAIEADGLLGRAVYRGPWRVLAPVLEAAATVHIGHGASWGLGGVEMTAEVRPMAERTQDR